MSDPVPGTVMPLTAAELLELARRGKPIPADRVLATFAHEANWVQIYRGETAPGCGYQAMACEWAFIGPVRPPFELAQHAMSKGPT